MTTEKLRKIYSEANVDAILLEAEFLRKYVTGIATTDGIVILDDKTCKFVIDLRYFEAVERELQGSPVEAVLGGEAEAMELLKQYKTIGVPFPYTDLERAEKLKSMGFALVDCMPVLKRAMLIKTEEEISHLQRACEIAEDGLLRLMGSLKEGMTERAAAAYLEYQMKELGAEGTSFQTILAFGPNGSVPHHETGHRKLQFGDIVLVDFGCKFNGYCSDCTRTFLFGDDKKHEDFKKAYQAVLGAHELVKEKVHAGMTGREADAVARDYLIERGYGKLFTHSLGHGIGLLIHEFPRLAPRSEEVLSDGMVFSDEPGVYEKGEYGIRIEDSCYMKDGKVISFMKKTDRNLIIL